MFLWIDNPSVYRKVVLGDRVRTNERVPGTPRLQCKSNSRQRYQYVTFLAGTNDSYVLSERVQSTHQDSRNYSQ